GGATEFLIRFTCGLYVPCGTAGAFRARGPPPYHRRCRGCGVGRTVYATRHYNNDTQFKNDKVEKLCRHFNIQQVFSSPHYPQGNGQAETFNKAIICILRMTVVKSKRE
ncbi:hypothetical protein ACLOJK_034450, partial [Asimina triloba]